MKYLLVLLALLLFQKVNSQSLGNPELPDSIVINSHNAPFRKTPFNTGEILFRVGSGTKAKLTGLSEDHLKIRIDTTEGYISYVFVDLRGTQLKEYYSEYVLEKSRKEQAAQDSILKEKFRQEEIQRHERYEIRLKELSTKYGATIGKRIANKEIWIGMSEDLLLESWGFPEEINRTVTTYLVRKQYVYPRGQYVYVENGKVTAWQD
ncbi:MAG: hypothetical protein LPJ98_01770 [Cyclobacteriaceae bacterium]|nr:hypothetical protein [Cyclobacteriaceae bacterium]